MTTDLVRFAHVEFASVVATEWTEWTFARFCDSAGDSADVELTAGDDTSEVVRLAAEAGFPEGRPIAAEADVPAMLGLDERLRRDLVLATR